MVYQVADVNELLGLHNILYIGTIAKYCKFGNFRENLYYFHK